MRGRLYQDRGELCKLQTWQMMSSKNMYSKKRLLVSNTMKAKMASTPPMTSAKRNFITVEGLNNSKSNKRKKSLF